MKNLRWLLYPVSVLYGAITRIRNKAFNEQWLRSDSFNKPVVAIGNLSMGGTGKTPMSEFLLEKLKPLQLGFVSRGYARNSRGLREINLDSKVTEVGDEPLQIKQRFPALKAVVAEKRKVGIAHLLQKEPALQGFILDDAFQHRAVKADYQILLTTWEQPFFRDQIVPVGNLREAKEGAKRAHCIVVTKCPAELDKKDTEKYIANIRRYADVPVYFSCLDYEPAPDAMAGKEIVLATAVARPEDLKRHLQKSFKVAEHLRYPDHHAYNINDVKHIRYLVEQNANRVLVTTAKDYTKLRHLLPASLSENLWVQRVQHRILFDEEAAFLQPVRRLFGT